MKYLDLKAKLPMYTLALAILVLAMAQISNSSQTPVAKQDVTSNSDLKKIVQVLAEFANENAQIKSDVASLSQELAELKSCLAAQQNMGVRVVC
jgi:septal ring factor EnvC (AmiA/AmiB activator)